jgi:hypothetical protein
MTGFSSRACRPPRNGDLSPVREAYQPRRRSLGDRGGGRIGRRRKSTIRPPTRSSITPGRGESSIRKVRSECIEGGTDGGSAAARAVAIDQDEGAHMNRIEYLARCHCGALTARYRTALAPAAWPVRACQCSFCRSHGALSTSDPAGVLEFRSTDPSRVQRYRFGGRTADFMICPACGVFVGVQMDTDKGRFGVLNVLSLRPLLALAAAEPMDYSAESAEGRRLRRETRWTPVAAGSV